MSIGVRNIRLFIFKFFDNLFHMRHSQFYSAMDSDRLLCNHLDRFLNGYLLVGSQGELGWQKKTDSDWIHLCCANCASPDLQTLLFQTCIQTLIIYC